MRGLKHIIGCIGIAITLDFLLFNGFYTDASSEVLSQASSQMLTNLKQFKKFSPTQLIHQFF